jgi:hypothetical protein
MAQVPYELPTDVLDLGIEGIGIEAGRLRTVLETGRTLLIFLRHFG